MITYYKDKQSGEIITEDEMLELVDCDDQLDSFFLVGDFKSEHRQNTIHLKTK